MRRSGKTTRLIDEAVQLLFEHGEITILNNYKLFNRRSEWKRGLTDKQIELRLKLVDYDAREDNQAQYYFIDGLKRRLYNEHRGSFTEGGNVFKLNK